MSPHCLAPEAAGIGKIADGLREDNAICGIRPMRANARASTL